jgi:O-antigen/teichoic acid export membrane protein
LKDTFLYGGAAAISKASAFISFPLLAHHLSKADYGTLDFYLVMGSLLVVLFVFGQDGAVARYFYEYEDPSERKQIISQSLIFQLAGLLLFLPIVWIFADFLSGLLINVPNRIELFKIVLLQIPFLLLINFSRNLLKWTFARNQFLILSLGAPLLQVGLLYFAVKYLDADIILLLKVFLLSNFIFSLLGLCFIVKWLTIPCGFKRLGEMLPFAIPVGVIGVLGIFSPTMERICVEQLLGVSSLGDYAVATKIAMLIAFAANAFQTAWGPFSLSIHKGKNASETYNWVLKFFCLCTCILTLIITMVAQPLVNLLASEKFNGSVILVFPLVMGLAIQAVSWVTEIGIGISKRSHLNLYSFASNLIVTILGIYFLTPILGILGVGLAVMVGFLTKALVASYLAQDAYKLDWSYRPVIMIMLVTLLFGLASVSMQHISDFTSSNLILFLGIIVIISVGWMVLLNRNERKRVLSIIRIS